MNCVLAVLALLAAPQEWWNGEWKHRRRVSIKNILDAGLKAGHPVSIEFDPAYLGLTEKSRADLGDLALVHGGKPVPFVMLPGRSPDARVLWFRAGADIRAGGTDGGYALYYGNPAAPGRDPRPGVFDCSENFSGGNGWRERLAPEEGLNATVEEGRLVIRDPAGDRAEGAPSRISFKGTPPEGGFAISFDIEIDAPPGAIAGFQLVVDLVEGGAAAMPKNIARLVAQIGDDDWQARDRATHDLVAIGRAAIAALEEAVKSADAEVKWRALHILKQIRENAPSPVISAGVMVGDPQAWPVALTHAIGKERGKLRGPGERPARVLVTLQRDPDGDVTLLWNGGRSQAGRLPGKVRQIGWTLFHSGPAAVFRVDNLLIGRHVDDDSRPTHTIDVEETRPK